MQTLLKSIVVFILILSEKKEKFHLLECLKNVGAN